MLPHFKILYLFVSILIALLCTTYSGDSLSYAEIFNDIKLLSYYDIINDLSPTKEPLFLLLTKLWSRFFSAEEFIFVITLISLLIKTLTIHKIFGKDAVIVYLLLFSLWFDGTLLRTGVATTIIFLIYRQYLNKKFKISAFLTLIACGIHLSAILPIILFTVFLKIRIDKNIIFSIFILVVPTASLMNFDLGAYFLDFIAQFNERYAQYDVITNQQNSTGLFFYFNILFLIISMYFLIRYKTLSTAANGNIFFNIYCIATSVLFIFSTHVAIAARLFDILSIVLVPIFFNLLSSKEIEKFEKLLIYIFCLLFFTGKFWHLFYWSTLKNPIENQLIHLI